MQMAKAAICAGLEVLLQKSNISHEQIKKYMLQAGLAWDLTWKSTWNRTSANRTSRKTHAGRQQCLRGSRTMPDTLKRKQ